MRWPDQKREHVRVHGDDGDSTCDNRERGPAPTGTVLCFGTPCKRCRQWPASTLTVLSCSLVTRTRPPAAAMALGYWPTGTVRMRRRLCVSMMLTLLLPALATNASPVRGSPTASALGPWPTAMVRS